MLYKLLWLIKEDWGYGFTANVLHTVDIFSVEAGKNVKSINMKYQLIADYENLMENGITDRMFSD